MRLLRLSTCCALAWLLVLTGLIAIAATPVDADDGRLAHAQQSTMSALERARSAEAFGGVRSQAPADRSAGLDQIQMHLLDRAKQEVSEAIWQPGFRMWPSSDHLQLVGLKTWFRVEDDAWNAPVNVRLAFGEPPSGPDPAVPSDVLTAGAPAPSLVQYKFSDATYSCPIQGKAWTPGAASTGSCRRGWDRTTAAEPQEVQARLVYDIEWELNAADGSTARGTFRSYGQWTAALPLTVGELGTVASDGTAASQGYPPSDAGPDMASTTWQDPDACSTFEVRCYASKGISKLWSWTKAALRVSAGCDGGE